MFTMLCTIQCDVCGSFWKCCVTFFRATVEEDRREGFCGSRRVHSMQLCKLQLPPEVCVTFLWPLPVATYLVMCHQQIQSWQGVGFLMVVVFFSLVHHLLHAVCSKMTSSLLKGKSLRTLWPRLFREEWALTTRSLDTSSTESTTVCFLPGEEKNHLVNHFAFHKRAIKLLFRSSIM